jgi:hypothetical protein
MDGEQVVSLVLNLLGNNNSMFNKSNNQWRYQCEVMLVEILLGEVAKMTMAMVVLVMGW